MEPLASIGCENKFIIEMLVDEVDIVRISKNQKVLVNLDAYANEIFTARVSKILPQKDERNQTFTVEALFEESPEVLYPGLSGEASIVIAVKKNVLTIPKHYLSADNMVKTDKGLIPIEIGIQNLEFVEVISGLDENTTIYK
jgi:multidrug efflux pump subunit AcrA (membrane-fusion protein)